MMRAPISILATMILSSLTALADAGPAPTVVVDRGPWSEDLSNVTFTACEKTVYNSTLGLFTAAGAGASATIISREYKARGTLMNLVAYTEFHVVDYVCPGIKQGDHCNVRAIADTTCGRILDEQESLHLDHVYNDNSVDVAIISIRGIKLTKANNFLSCLENMSTSSSYTPQPGDQLFRIGYGGKVKNLRYGFFAGFTDINPQFKKPAIPAGEGAGMTPLTKVVTTIPIGHGDCGGPVVEQNSCQLIGTSQIGPVNGKSFDIPALLFDRLVTGEKIDHLQATEILHEEDYDTVLHRFDYWAEQR
jgi:hypothetical protein